MLLVRNTLIFHGLCYLFKHRRNGMSALGTGSYDADPRYYVCWGIAPQVTDLFIYIYISTCEYYRLSEFMTRDVAAGTHLGSPQPASFTKLLLDAR